MASQPPAAQPQSDEPDAVEDVPEELAVRLETFEGPLDLLLELIRKHEIDIFDIPIALITEEYLGYIERMEQVDLQVGGEWLEMAATLIYIKSRTLLPDDEEDEEEEGPDPREELVRRLIEYKKYKMIADKLDELPKLDHEVFTHREQASRYEQMVGPPELEETGVSSLVSALRRLIERQDDDTDWVVDLTRETLSLRSVMLDVARLLQRKPRVTFEELFEEHQLSRYRVVTTFLALLEMTKRSIIKLMQSRLSDDDHLYIERAVIDIMEVSQSLDLPETIEG
ncbi:MAG: segregation and condensation protein A [Persicimonas sp.]